QTHPDNARAVLGLGRAAYERGELSEAVSYLQRATADGHTRKAARTLLAQAYERLGNKAAAEQALRQASELPPDAAWPDPLQETVHEFQVGKQTALARAHALVNQGQFPGALALLQQ